jgi:hypothetical protein
VARRPQQGDRGVSQGERHAVVGVDVPVRVSAQQFPVCGIHHDPRTAPLQHLRAADVIAVGMRNDHVLDVVGIESQPPHAADDQLVRVIRVERVENDEALAGLKGPARVHLAADEVQVVEDLCRIRVPRRSWWSRARVPHLRRNDVHLVDRPQRWQQAQPRQRSQKLESGRPRCRPDRVLDLAV